MRGPRLGRCPTGDELLLGELADRLQHRKPGPPGWPVGDQQRFTHQGVQQIQHGVVVGAIESAYYTSTLEVESTREHRTPLQQCLLRIIEVVVRPRHGVAQRLMAFQAAPSSSEGTSHNCSSATPNPSRLVAKILTVADCARISSTRSAAASRTCSQLSNTNSRMRPSNAAATDWPTLLPGCWVMPSTAATASGTAAGSATAASSKNQTPSGNSSTRRAATSNASRVLPTPPTPVNVTNRRAFTTACTSSSSDSRPMKLVGAGRRFPGPASSARNDGKFVRRPGARTWNT